MAAVEKPAKKRSGAPLGNTNGKGNAGQPRGQSLTKELGSRICERIAAGLPMKFAAMAEGVSENTVSEWARRGEGKDDRPSTPLMEWFAAEKKKARARFVQARITEIVADEDWHAKAWSLERMFPEDFARPADRLELTGSGGGPVTIRLAFDPTPIPARPRVELGGPVIDVEAEELA